MDPVDYLEEEANLSTTRRRSTVVDYDYAEEVSHTYIGVQQSILSILF